jgi:hypothetical protein
MKDSHITLRVSEALSQALERAAEARGIAKSMLVREAVAQYLVGAPPERSTPPMTLDAFIARWRTLPRLSAEEAQAYADDIEAARAELPAPRDPWE